LLRRFQQRKHSSSSRRVKSKKKTKSPSKLEFLEKIHPKTGRCDECMSEMYKKTPNYHNQALVLDGRIRNATTVFGEMENMKAAKAKQRKNRRVFEDISNCYDLHNAEKDDEDNVLMEIYERGMKSQNDLNDDMRDDSEGEKIESNIVEDSHFLYYSEVRIISTVRASTIVNTQTKT